MSSVDQGRAGSGQAIGFGLGLRAEHYEEILETPGRVDWFEALSENYMVAGGKPLHYLDRIRRDYPMALHGVSLSIGASDPIDHDYVDALKRLAHRVEPLWISDHLCWASHRGINLHDLLPLPYTEEALRHVVGRVIQVQDLIGRRILLENVSSYVTYAASTINEWEFLAEVARRADCDILLDINNIFVSAFNHAFDPVAYLHAVPAARVRQLHLAGHSHMGTHIIDTHDNAIVEGVWTLYGEALRLFGPVPTMIERDDDIPPYAELLRELDHARTIARCTLEPMVREAAA